MKLLAPLLGLSVFVPLGLAKPASTPQSIGKVLPLGSIASILKSRAPSNDASCPQGYLCQQGSCGENVYCDYGEVCVNFEGASACASSNLKLCALNPDSMTGVACPAADGVCCHGNCYAKGTVCCDRPSVQCSIGESCNACAEGLTCGSTGCVGGTSSSTSKSSSASSPPTSVTQVPTSTTSRVSSTSSTTTRPVSSPTPLPSIGSWTHKGCWSDSTSQRVLVSGSYVDTTGLTPEACVARAAGFRYAGFENAGECYWGYTRSSSSLKVDDSTCSAACAGNKTITCGGNAVMNLYENSEVVPPSPTSHPAIGDWSLQGCWSDSANPRALEHSFTDNEGMSVRACSLKAAGYKYFGVEAGNECWYGNTLDPSSQKQTSGCSTACVGWITQQCGGGWRLSLYLNNAYVPGPSSTSASVSTTSRATSGSTASTIPVTSSTVGTISTLPTSTLPITSSSQPPSSPTIVPSVGSFKKPTCFFDSTTSRMLRNGSSVDHSTTGMTVEKCVDLADGWRYAGVEYGGECYWGDVPYNPEESSQQDCAQRCDGNPQQVCGGGNRILRYEDEDWEDPTRTELVQALQDYYEKLAQIQDAVQKWHNLVQQYEDQDLSGSGIERRQLNGLLVKIDEALSYARYLAGPYIAQVAIVSKWFNIARRYVTVNQAELGAYIELRDLTAGSITTIQSANAADVVGGLAIKIARTAISVLGKPYIAIPTGIFGLLDSLIHILASNPGGPPDDPPTTTVVATSTTATASTTSSCSPSLSPTPMVVIAQHNVDEGAMLKIIPSDKLIDEIHYPTIGFQAYLADLDDCQAEKLLKESIVASVSLNADIEQRDASGGAVIGDPDPVDAQSNLGSLQPRSLEVGKDLVLQTPAPLHLKTLSSLWAKSQSHDLAGSTFYDTDGFLHNPTASGDQVNIYVLDDAVYYKNLEFGSKGEKVVQNFGRPCSRIHTNNPNKCVDDNPIPRMPSFPAWNGGTHSYSHGTLVAAFAAGSFSGVAKSAGIVSVELFTNGERWLLFELLHGFIRAANHVVTNNKQGRAVFVMSWGVYPTSLWWGPGNHTIPADKVDPFSKLFDQYAYANGIVLVNAAPNIDGQALNSQEPERSGGRTKGLIVVGNCDASGKNAGSSENDPTGTGILSIYAMGSNVCAGAEFTREKYRCASGTSFAAPQVAGLAAHYLSVPAVRSRIMADGYDKVSLNMKNHLRQVGFSRRGHSNGNVPRAALDEEIDCTASNAPALPSLTTTAPPISGTQWFANTYPELDDANGNLDFGRALHPAASGPSYILNMQPLPTCVRV